ncbi:ATP-dependent Clp protease ATP-binding subunit ClpX [Halorhodospira halophila]|uniref:ATP-dependent Clp protease, ATP-binding subunit ClpX n=1 Tax=Halorhodospira halophila (strain DSM 244 / SL1) TaxID=349124 RepID=A1WVR1_HALHL|nr:ATP-dependent Clp protease ATP-binding subunit ClpX [Halorhodospira halophila]ABM61773.1 ATP-dependent Clp protease, ATP-binding subunit ClpX [Halorhodospira halophila SL1]
MPGWCGDVSGAWLDVPESAAGVPTDAERRCSFCGYEEQIAGPLIGGEAAFICEHCIASCNATLEADRQHRQERILAALPVPRSLRRYLDQYVVGQEQAKKVLSVAVYNHYKRLVAAARGESVELGKSNILLVGPSGTGKSHLAECLARCVEVPFVTVDATTLTASGYAGDDAEAVIGRLLAACDGDPERAARGIVYIDEIDKLAARDGIGGEPDLAGEGAQQGLLKLLEGRRLTVSSAGRQGSPVTVDTGQILFICGGAFEGLEALAAQRPGVGFTAAADEPAVPGAAAALQRFGLLPELVGRLPVVETLQPLATEHLIRILTEPRNALVRQYQVLFARDGCELEITADGLEAVAHRARARGTGARGLRAVLEEVLLEPMFAVPAAGGDVVRLTIDAAAVQGGQPGYEWRAAVRHAV